MDQTSNLKNKAVLQENLRIEASKTQLLQLMEYPDFDDPTHKHRHVFASFANARFSDASNQEIFSGIVHVWIRTTLTPASLAILSRLLHSNDGNFVMIVNGSYGVNEAGPLANVYADEVTWTSIQRAGATSGASARALVDIPAPPRRMPVGL